MNNERPAQARKHFTNKDKLCIVTCSMYPICLTQILYPSVCTSMLLSNTHL